jgi:hypothetical protein
LGGVGSVVPNQTAAAVLNNAAGTTGQIVNSGITGNTAGAIGAGVITATNIG